MRFTPRNEVDECGFAIVPDVLFSREIDCWIRPRGRLEGDIMNAHHKLLLAGITKHQRKRAHTQANDSYLSSGHRYYDVSVPARRALAKSWLKENRTIADRDFLSVLDGLYRGKSHEEKTLASILLAYHRAGRKAVGSAVLDSWLDHLVGWAEIDSLCQGVFSADEVLGSWTEWRKFIRRLSRDQNINKRRAALVFLTGPARTSNDARIVELAFEIIDRLKAEREIIITKAISWLLRNLVQHHKRDVAHYIDRNSDTLPAIGVREAARKIKTGRK
jgi:3-methyladenine DNA glycosylase AlkD